MNKKRLYSTFIILASLILSVSCDQEYKAGKSTKSGISRGLSYMGGISRSVRGGITRIFKGGNEAFKAEIDPMSEIGDPCIPRAIPIAEEYPPRAIPVGDSDNTLITKNYQVIDGNHSECSKALAQKFQSSFEAHVTSSNKGKKPIEPSASIIEVDEKGRQIGKPLYSKNGDKLEKVASSQKIITAYLLFKHRQKVRYPTTMGGNAKKVVYTQSGNIMEYDKDWWRSHQTGTLTENQLLHGILKSSSNGASFRAMELITGSSDEKEHAKLINQEVANILGPNHKTKFSNSHGLDSYNYGSRGGNQKPGVNGSTPLELARIHAKIQSDPEYKAFLISHNANYPSKAGITSAAGKNYVKYKTVKTACGLKHFAYFYGGGRSGTPRDLGI